MRGGFSGWLLSNGGLRIPKFTDQLQWLADTFESHGVSIRSVLNQELSACVLDGVPAVLYQGMAYGSQLRHTGGKTAWPDFVLFWDKDVRLARMLEAAGFRLFNPAGAIAACDDKSETHRLLAGKGIPMPDTLVAPFYFPDSRAEQDSFVDQTEQRLGYPVVVKESFGSFGAQVYLAASRQELEALHQRLLYTPHLSQRYVSSSHGRDVRLQVVGDRVVAAMKRTAVGDFRANVSAGAVMEPFTPPPSFCELAIAAARTVGACFAGVDLLFGDRDAPLVCEVNSNAHMRNIQQCTGVDVPRQIVRYVLGVLTGGEGE